MGAWIETLILVSVLLGLLVAPSWARGLKPAPDDGRWFQSEVAPSWARGLKRR